MKITAVMAARNDNYGGHMLEALGYCLQTMSNVFDEIVLIDYDSQKSLYDELSSLIHTGKIRIIEVSKNDLFEDAQKVSFPDPILRNIGIRRASNDLILSTNIDIIPGPKRLFDLADYNKDIAYTSNKFHIPLQLIQIWKQKANFEQIQEILTTNANQFMRERIISNEDDLWSIVSGCGDFQLMHKDIWHHPEVRGFEETMLWWGYTDSNLHKKVMSAGYTVTPESKYEIFHIDHPSGSGGRMNDRDVYLMNFTKTTNTDNWGLSDKMFEEKIL